MDQELDHYFAEMEGHELMDNSEKLYTHLQMLL